MIDRLVAGAGAVSAAVDRVIRSLVPGGGFGHQPVSLFVAAVLVVLAALLVAVGLESSGGATPEPLDPAAIGRGEEPGGRIHATMVGRLPGTYVETFDDLDEDGVQDPEETGQAWDYFLLGIDSRDGIVVRSRQAPATVYAYAVSGTVVEDASYVEADLAVIGDDFSVPGIQLDPTRYVVANGIDIGPPHDLAAGFPPTGSDVALRESRAIEYLTVCSTDPDGDGQCTADEVDLYDVFVYDAGTGRAMIVVTDQSPEYQPATFTGMLRKDARAVGESLAAPGVSLDDYGITLSATYLLDEGAEPADLMALVGLAAIALLLAGVIAIGVAGGYVRFDHAGSLPAGSRSMLPGERMPARVTGVLRGPAGTAHVREAPVDLIRFVLAPTTMDDTDAVPAGEPSAGEAPTTLILERPGRPEGIAVGRGELTTIAIGTVTTFRAHRPGLQLTAGTGRLTLGFGSVEDRDRAAAELVAEAGLDPGQPPAPTPSMPTTPPIAHPTST